MTGIDRRFFARLVVLVSIILLHPHVVLAEVKNGFEIEFYGGTFSTDLGGKTFVLDEDRTIVTQGDDGDIFGLRLGYNFNRHIGMELNAAYSTAQYDAILFDAGEHVSKDETTGLFITDLDLVLHLLKGPIVPFLAAGGGIMGTVDQSPFTYNYGGGVKVFLTKQLAIRVDYREYRGTLDDDLDEIFGVIPPDTFVGHAFSYSEDFRLRELSVGLTYVF